MQGIIGATIFVVVFWGLYKFKDYDRFNPERIKDWGRAEGTITKAFPENCGRKYYVSFSDAHGKHLGCTHCYYGAKVLYEGDKVNIRYNFFKHVQGTGADSSVIIEGIEEKESESKFDSFFFCLLCAIGFGIFDIYLIVQEIMKLIAN